MNGKIVLSLLFVFLASLYLTACALQPLEMPAAQLEQPQAPMAESLELPAVYAATDIGAVAGEWLCDTAEGTQVIRLDVDGSVNRVFAPDDVVDIGYFWFTNDEFHVVSDVDGQALESVFHVIVESNEDGTVLRLEQCGGNCPNAGDIEWLRGLTRVESES